MILNQATWSCGYQYKTPTPGKHLVTMSTAPTKFKLASTVVWLADLQGSQPDYGKALYPEVGFKDY